MRTNPAKHIFLGALLGGVLALAGCSGSGDSGSAPDTAAPTSVTSTAVASEAKKQGGLINFTPRPAPAGEKVGLEGGLKQK